MGPRLFDGQKSFLSRLDDFSHAPPKIFLRSTPKSCGSLPQLVRETALAFHAFARMAAKTFLPRTMLVVISLSFLVRSVFTNVVTDKKEKIVAIHSFMPAKRLKAALALFALCAASSALAAPPQCYTYYGSGYCQYTGRVSRVYVNSSNQIILYFDAAMSPTAPSSVGISGVSVFDSGIYNITDNPDYAKMLYASLLAAQARGAIVDIQLWGTSVGYMKLDRIWVNE